jgi:nucleoid DNA-binding protein
MTERDLIATLAKECDITRTQVDDFLAALGDLFIEALEKGDTVNLPTIGVFRIDVRKAGRTVKWFTTAETREKLRLISKGKKLGPMCLTCGKRERYPGRRDCRLCVNEKQKAVRKEAKR